MDTAWAGMQGFLPKILVAFGLAPCSGSVLWYLWLQKALEPLPAVIPGGSVSLPKDAGTWPRGEQIFLQA